jgi:predicted CoA-binding protein
MKKTLVLGATPNPERYAYLATRKLLQYGHEVVPVGIKQGEINGLEILQGQPAITDVDTITMYVGAERQPPYYDYLLGLKPKRMIFNPGAENDELAQLAEKQGVEIVEGCTLVMLSIGTY